MGRNMLVDGEWKTDVEPYTDEDGAFDRAETSFRDWIRDDPEATFQPDTDRYHLYDPINNGVYRAGFAESQRAYDDAVTDVFDALGHWDEVLADQRYLAGDRLTLADVRMFPTLIRFDAAYHTGFKCDRQYLHQYDHLWPYLRDLYRTPGVAETVRMDDIRDQGYFQGEITPVGPDLDYEAPHDRDRLPGERPTSSGG